MEFVKVSKDVYLSVLDWVDREFVGYTVVPMPIADKIAFYSPQFGRFPIVNKYAPMYGDPESYEVRKDVFLIYSNKD